MNNTIERLNAIKPLKFIEFNGRFYTTLKLTADFYEVCPQSIGGYIHRLKNKLRELGYCVVDTGPEKRQISEALELDKVSHNQISLWTPECVVLLSDPLYGEIAKRVRAEFGVESIPKKSTKYSKYELKAKIKRTLLDEPRTLNELQFLLSRPEEEILAALRRLESRETIICKEGRWQINNNQRFLFMLLTKPRHMINGSAPQILRRHKKGTPTPGVEVVVQWSCDLESAIYQVDADTYLDYLVFIRNSLNTGWEKIKKEMAA